MARGEREIVLNVKRKAVFGHRRSIIGAAVQHGTLSTFWLGFLFSALVLLSHAEAVMRLVPEW